MLSLTTFMLERLETLLIWTKNFYQRIPPDTLKVVWILLNPTKFAQKIDLLIKVPDVAPSTVEKKRFLQMCQIKKVTPPGLQTFWDHQLCFYVKKIFFSEKKNKKWTLMFFKGDLCHQILPRTDRFGKIWWHKSPVKNNKVHFSVFFH